MKDAGLYYRHQWKVHQHGQSHFGTEEPICPHCKYEQEDAWEYGEALREEIECNNCGGTYVLTTNTVITYDTQPACVHKWVVEDTTHISTPEKVCDYVIFRCVKCGKREDVKDLVREAR